MENMELELTENYEVLCPICGTDQIQAGPVTVDRVCPEDPRLVPDPFSRLTCMKYICGAVGHTFKVRFQALDTRLTITVRECELWEANR